MTSKESVDNLLKCQNLAIVGVSQKGSKFGNAVYRELRKKGFNVYGVNQNMDMVEGDKCYNKLNELKGKIDGIVNVVSKDQTLDMVTEANDI